MDSPASIMMEGHISADTPRGYHSLPFNVPDHTTRIDISYVCTPDLSDLRPGENPLDLVADLEVFDSRGAEFMGAGYRGTSGNSRSAIFIADEDATPGYTAGKIQPGEWTIVLGFFRFGPAGCGYQVNISFTSGDPISAEPLSLLPLRTWTDHPVNPSGWYKGELHCHTFHSDGDSSPLDVLAKAESLGLDFLAITDHNNITHLMEIAALGVQKIILIPGYEVTTYRGHWNVWGPDTWVDFRVNSPKDMQKALKFAYKHTALASINHPRPYGPPWEYEKVYSNQCVEVWNGHWMYMNDVALAFWEERLQRGEHLVAVGGSDMHRLHAEHEARLGTPTTWIYCPGDPTAADLLAELKAGHAFISDAPDGPRLYFSSGQAMTGDTVKRTSDTLDVAVRVADGVGLTLQLIGSDGILRATPVIQDDQPFIFTVPITQTKYVRAQLIEPNSDDLVVRALTNPIYID